MRTFPPGGGRREITIVCPSCQFQSTVPPAAVGRNSYFCSSCGKAVDLPSQTFRAPGAPGVAPGTGAPPPRRDRGSSKYKSSRKGRR